MNIKIFLVLLLTLVAPSVLPAQVPSNDQIISPGRQVEREIAGGESHIYQITLMTGQYVRVRLDQLAIDATLILTAPDGKQSVEMNLTRAGDEESLSFESAAAGTHRLTVQAKGMETLRGSYRLSTNWKDAATEQDKQRIAAESLMIEAQKLAPLAGKGAPQIIENLQKAVPTWREQNETSWEAWSLRRIGKAYSAVGSQDKAIEHLGQAISRYQAAKNRSGEGETLMDLGLAYSMQSQFEQASEHYQKALEINREAKNLGAEGEALLLLGQASNYLVFFEKGFEYAASAINISKVIEDRTLETRLLFVQGYSYLNLSRFEKAIEIFERALALSRELKNRRFEGAAYGNLGACYANTNRLDKGIEYNKMALEIQREFGDRPAQANNLLNISNNFNNSGEYDNAVAYAEEALKISREIGQSVNESRALHHLANVYLNLKKYDQALEYNELSLQIARTSKRPVQESAALLGSGYVFYQLKQFDRAILVLEPALQIRRGLQDQIGVVNILHQIGWAELQRGNLEQARTYAEEGIQIVEGLRSDLGSSEFRSAYFGSVSAQGVYRLYTDVLMLKHRNEPTKGFDAQAVDSSERQRARSLLDLLGEARTDLRQGVDAKLIERERVLGRQLNDKARSLTQAAKPEQAATLKQEISQLENDYERTQGEIRKASPRYTALIQQKPLSLKQIQEQLDADTLLLEYSLSEERSYLWAISRNSLKSYVLPKGEQITQSAMQAYELLTARSTNKRGETAAQRKDRIAKAEAKLPSVTQELSRVLLGPVASELGNKRLVIVADGALQYIPFAMLPIPTTAEDTRAAAKMPPLIVDHEIVSLPSASALALQRSELAGRPLAPKMLAVIADPVFDRTDERFASVITPAGGPVEIAKRQNPSFADSRGLEHIADSSADAGGRVVIRRLPFTSQESDALLTLVPKASRRSDVGFQANRANVLNGDLSQYRYVHFATHGLLDSERPGLSALVLSTVDENGKPQDGFLRANDIYNMKLPAELVVLSACQTGLGKEVKGEGMIGLTRGFMYAGARRVVVSLWSVNDKATSDLMTKFYRGMLQKNERPAAALRAAQIEMWKQKQWQSPYYRAAFTMQGEWK